MSTKKSIEVISGPSCINQLPALSSYNLGDIASLLCCVQRQTVLPSSHRLHLLHLFNQEKRNLKCLPFCPIVVGRYRTRSVAIRVRDLETKDKLWICNDWATLKRTSEMHLPRRTLRCGSVAREFTFYSRSMLQNLRLQQIVELDGHIIEEWNFQFGFVIPGSTNTWDNVVVAAPSDQMLPAEVLSGRMVIDTRFFDGDRLLASKRLTVYYE